MTPLPSALSDVVCESLPPAGLHPTEPHVQPLDDRAQVPDSGKLRRLSHAKALAAAETVMAVTVLVMALLATNRGRMPYGPAEFLALRVSLKNLLLLSVFVLSWPALFRCLGLYDGMRLPRFRDEAARLLLAGSVGTLLTLTFSFFSKSGAFGVRQVLYFWVANTVAGLGLRVLWRPLWETQRRRGTRRVIIVGAGPRAADVYDSLISDAETHYEIAGLIDSTPRLSGPRLELPELGTLAELEDILMRQPIDEVFIALPVRSHYRQIEETIRICERAGVHAKYRADIFEPAFAQPNYEAWDGSHVMAMHVVPHDYRVKIKRVLDVAGAVFLLVLLAPVMLLVALGIKMTSPGPVVFSQQRYGLNKRRFGMYKFRTMVPNAEQLQAQLEDRNEAAGPVFKIAHDPRVTPLGRFLRRTSLDELPQLWNVVRGDMSLVGPRPLPIRDVVRFTRPTDMRRFSVPPGLTCLWQISGRSNLNFDRWIELDLRYIDRWSLGLDLIILLKTVPAVFNRAGAL
jgi:exopolysaccharide biosynthesis polyprenyl glycosylphosphotransferase